MKKLSPIFLVIILVLLAVGVIYWRNQNQSALPPEQSNWQTYKNDSYGFEINFPGEKYTAAEDADIIEPLTGKQEAQYQLSDSVTVSVIKNITPQDYAKALASEAGAYLTNQSRMDVNGLAAEHLEMGYASGYVNHEYFFEKDNNTIAVVIYTLKDSTEYQNIIKSFKLR